MVALGEKKHIQCPTLIFGLSVSFSVHLKAKSFILKGCGCSLFVSRCSSHERSVLQLRQNSFLAKGTTKGNSKTSVIYRLTGLNVLGTLVPPIIFFKRKGESFFSPQRSLTTNAETSSPKLPVFASTFCGCCETSDCKGLSKVCSQVCPTLRPDNTHCTKLIIFHCTAGAG